MDKKIILESLKERRRNINRKSLIKWRENNKEECKNYNIRSTIKSNSVRNKNKYKHKIKYYFILLKESLIEGAWYIGAGSKFNCALWDGQYFHSFCVNLFRMTESKTKHYSDGGSFAPFAVVRLPDPGNIKDIRNGSFYQKELPLEEK